MLSCPRLHRTRGGPPYTTDRPAARAAGTLIAICRIRLPEGYRTDLPDAAHIKSNFASVDKRYRFDGKELVIERTIVVLAPKLPKSEWAQYKTFAKDSGFDGEPWIQLIRPPLSEPPLPRRS